TIIGALVGLVIGLAGWLVGGLAGRLMAGMLFGLVDGLAISLSGALVFGLQDLITSPNVARRASTPTASLHGDRTLYLVRVVSFGLWLGLIVALICAPFGGLVIGLAIGLTNQEEGKESAWPKFLIASVLLAGQRHLPLRLMDFLQDAYRLGLLRIV